MNFTRSAVHISDAYQRDIIEAQGTIGSREHTQFVTQVVADTGGWTPPPGATVIPNGGGFQIVNNNGTPWNGGTAPNYSLSAKYDDNGNPTHDGRGYGGSNSSKSKEEWEATFENAFGDDWNGGPTRASR